MKHYLALTIGPIYRTISLARKTRELWMASFLFSRLMKNLLIEIEGTDDDKIGTILLPSTVGLKDNEKFHGAGVYHDRCIVELDKPLEIEGIRAIIDNAIKALNKELGGRTYESLSKYLLIYAARASFIEGELGSQKDEKPEKYLVFELNKILDSLELQTKYSIKESEGINLILSNSYRVHKMYKLGYGADDEVFRNYESDSNKIVRRLPSLLEIALTEFKDREDFGSTITETITKRLEQKKNNEKKISQVKEVEDSTDIEVSDDEILRDDILEQEDILLQLKQKYGDDFLLRHKYIAVVQADGDSIGNTIEALGNNSDNIKEFSHQLMQFARDASDTLTEFGALPIYIGGDDLLFLAPLTNERKENIFSLLEKLRNKFLEQPSLKDNGATLSFGVSVTYYKYPLSEALSKSYSLLNDEAKKYEWWVEKKEKSKNAIAFSVLKHSGQPFGATFGQNTKSFRAWKSMLDLSSDQIMTSLLYKIDQLFPLLEHAAADSKLLKAFFDNHFNEVTDQEQKSFLNRAQEFIYHFFLEYNQGNSEEEYKKRQQALYGFLRLVQFFNTKDQHS
ncbi:MAG: type III-B CRISPR-associated protein Cas10/Cmr2 [Bacteroidota bacterium]